MVHIYVYIALIVIMKCLEVAVSDHLPCEWVDLVYVKSQAGWTYQMGFRGRKSPEVYFYFNT